MEHSGHSCVHIIQILLPFPKMLKVYLHFSDEWTEAELAISWPRTITYCWLLNLLGRSSAVSDSWCRAWEQSPVKWRGLPSFAVVTRDVGSYRGSFVDPNDFCWVDETLGCTLILAFFFPDIFHLKGGKTLKWTKIRNDCFTHGENYLFTKMFSNPCLIHVNV